MDMRNGILGLLLITLLPFTAQSRELGLKECIRMGIERNLGLSEKDNQKLAAGMMCEIKVMVEQK